MNALLLMALLLAPPQAETNPVAPVPKQAREIPKQAAPVAPPPAKEPPAPKPSPEVVLEIAVTPMAAPVPALKYQLQSPLKDYLPGNPVAAWMKCFMEQANLYERKESWEAREKYLAQPLKELANEPGIKNYGGTSAVNARRAARMLNPDWNIIVEMKENGWNTLLPEVQKMRAIAQVMSVRIRGEIAAGELDEALTDITVLFSLARHLGEHPTIIGSLVGMSITQVAMDRLNELIAQPKAPNLYWALSQLPSPFLRSENAVSGELLMYPIGLKTLSDPNIVWTDKEFQEARELGVMFSGLADLTPEQRKLADTWLRQRPTDEKWLALARKNLVANGSPAAMVPKYTPEQVTFLEVVRESEIRQQEYLKYAQLPFSQIQDRLPGELAKDATPEAIALSTLNPPLKKYRSAQARVDQRLALLRGVEAVRLYAAANDGKLPPDLKATGVPVPLDPVTGQPIRYELVDGVAVIRGTPPKGMETTEKWSWVYRVKIAK